jgi:hypothetical protein
VHLGALELAKTASGIIGANVFGYNVIAIAVTLTLAAALYLLIERPVLLLKQRLPPGTAGAWPIIATVGAISIGIALILWRP